MSGFLTYQRLLFLDLVFYWLINVIFLLLLFRVDFALEFLLMNVSFSILIVLMMILVILIFVSVVFFLITVLLFFILCKTFLKLWRIFRVSFHSRSKLAFRTYWLLWSLLELRSFGRIIAWSSTSRSMASTHLTMLFHSKTRLRLVEERLLHTSSSANVLVRLTTSQLRSVVLTCFWSWSETVLIRENLTLHCSFFYYFGLSCIASSFCLFFFILGSCWVAHVHIYLSTYLIPQGFFLWS